MQVLNFVFNSTKHTLQPCMRSSEKKVIMSQYYLSSISIRDILWNPSLENKKQTNSYHSRKGKKMLVNYCQILKLYLTKIRGPYNIDTNTVTAIYMFYRHDKHLWQILKSRKKNIK